MCTAEKGVDGWREGKATVRNVKEGAPNKDEWAVVHT